MYELAIETQFSAAHQLRGYKGKCERLHGHNWRVQVSVSAEKLNEIGLAIDFNELKNITNEVLSMVDHSVLNETFPFTEINPSSENIAKWLYDSIKKKINAVRNNFSNGVNNNNVKLSAVTVWEAETSSATYYE